MTLKNLIRDKGFWLTLLLSFAVLFIFFGKQITHPNTVYFAKDGDGMQAYYGALFHIRYDTSYTRFNGMLYPYGESVFFTGNQPFISNTLKFLNTFFPVYPYTLGVLNLVMLLSLIACALSLYAIFRHLRLPYVYGAVVATGITFLSPQIHRLAAHFSLTYQFAIPLFIFLLFKFHEKPSLKRSCLLAALTLFMAGTQLYFLGFFAVLASFFYIFLFLMKEKNFRKLSFIGLHFFLQIILPFSLIQLVSTIGNSVSDRTASPWGFMTYIATWESIFLPIGKSYGIFVNRYLTFHPVDPEGIAYIGAVASLGCCIGLFFFLFYLIAGKIKKGINTTIFIALFLGSFLALLYSFAIPFIFNMEYLLPYMGFLRQMRAIARFSWPFYYVINLLIFYCIYKLIQNINAVLKYSIVVLVCAVLYYDAYELIKPMQENLNNRQITLADTNNTLDEDLWLQKIHIADYQALIGLPLVLIGSENIWVAPESDIMSDVFNLSLKTGLPMLNSILSRTSLSQTYKAVQLDLAPYRPIHYLNDLPNQKPFLVIVREVNLNPEEKELLKSAVKVGQSTEYNIYRLDIAAIKCRVEAVYTVVENNLKKTRLYPVGGGFSSNQPDSNFIFKNFEEFNNKKAYIGNGAYQGNLKDYNIVYSGAIPKLSPDSTYIFSFWMDQFTTDLYTRSTLEITLKDSTGQVYDSKWTSPRMFYKVIDGSWALIETSVKFRTAFDKFTVTLWNVELNKNEQLIFDAFLIRKAGATIYKKMGEDLFVNNRLYKNFSKTKH